MRSFSIPPDSGPATSLQRHQKWVRFRFYYMEFSAIHSVDESSSTSTTDSDDDNYLFKEEEDDTFMLQEDNVPEIDKETPRLAVVNLDWSQVRGYLEISNSSHISRILGGVRKNTWFHFITVHWN
ncbi:hypothetical protein C2S52_018632 [Perilla frutescens var. hirtella]|nr:hypothetical protein C2S52_018632 [Perilla frutescens var. hirtella]